MTDKDIGAIVALLTSHDISLSVIKNMLVKSGVGSDVEFQALVEDYTAKNFDDTFNTYHDLIRQMLRKK